jgi:hypothetical protein
MSPETLWVIVICFDLRIRSYPVRMNKSIGLSN